MRRIAFLHASPGQLVISIPYEGERPPEGGLSPEFLALVLAGSGHSRFQTRPHRRRAGGE